MFDMIVKSVRKRSGRREKKAIAMTTSAAPHLRLFLRADDEAEPAAAAAGLLRLFPADPRALTGIAPPGARLAVLTTAGAAAPCVARFDEEDGDAPSPPPPSPSREPRLRSDDAAAALLPERVLRGEEGEGGRRRPRDGGAS
jgi:hypothetical protein